MNLRMNITPSSLMTLPSYSSIRQQHKQQMIRHRRERSLALGPCMRLQFEDELTIRYQIQAVRHAQRLQGEDAAAHEIGTYAHLLPDGSNWKATLRIELPDAAERQRELPQLNEAAHRVYVDVARHPRVLARVNEDLPDGHNGRPLAVRVLCFQLPESLRAAVLAGATTTLGCAHDQYEFRRVIPPATLERLRRDLLSSNHELDHAVAER